jgi:hypothetical protein
VLDRFLAGLAQALPVMALPVLCLVSDHHVADHDPLKSFTEALNRELLRDHAGQLHVDPASLSQVRPPGCNPS